METSLGEVTTRTKATAQELGDEPTGRAGVAGLRLCLKWLLTQPLNYVVWSQSSHQEVKGSRPDMPGSGDAPAELSLWGAFLL